MQIVLSFYLYNKQNGGIDPLPSSCVHHLSGLIQDVSCFSILQFFIKKYFNIPKDIIFIAATPCRCF